jgi:hypothetical protein
MVNDSDLWDLTKQDMARLRQWAATEAGPSGLAAVQLLVEDDFWLQHEQFVKRCVHRNGDAVYVNFSDIRNLWLEGTYCSQGQSAMLLIIADIGSNHWPLGALDARAVRRVIGALGLASGQQTTD